MMYSADAKRCAQQIIKAHFNDILTDKFQIPSLTEMENNIYRNIDFNFDEYSELKRIERSHPEWSSRHISDELERRKMKYVQIFQVNLRRAAEDALNELEALIQSLKDTLKAWRISNLE
jgi:hypothetical protein